MEDTSPPLNQAARRLLISTLTAAMVAAVTVARPQAAPYDDVTPPPVPEDIQVEPGHKAFLAGAAIGTQNYICLPSGTGVAWTLFGPQATLFDGDGGQLITHFLSANPVENGTLRATWQHSRDTSSAWAMAIKISTDPAYVAPGAIPWLLLRVVGAQYGPGFGDRMTATTFIQRVNTVGGVAPATGCSQPTDVGKKAMVPYQADYIFYKLKD